MNINWRVRVANPVFWVQIALAIILPILTAFGMSWEDMTTWPALGKLLLDAIQSPVVVVAIIASIWNAVNDPTTSGLGDSTLAMTYNKPKK